MFFQLGHDSFEPFLEIAAVAGASQQRAHVERVDRGVGQNLGRFTGDDLACQPLGDGGFAHARITHQQRVVLAAAAEHLNATLDLTLAADQRVDIALAGFGVEVHAVFRQRGFLLVAIGDALGLFFGLGRACDRAGFTICRVFGDAVGDEVHRVIAGHILFLQEVGGVAFTFGEDGDKHVRARHFGPARGLHVDRGALDHALEGRRGHRFGTVDVGDQVAQIIVDEFDQCFAEIRDINGTGFHDLHGVGFVEQGQQQMFERCKFVAAGVCQREGRVDCLLKCSRE